MVILGNFRIKTVALLGIGALALVAIACSTGSIMTTKLVVDGYSYTSSNTVPSLLALANIEKRIEATRLLMAKHILSPSVAETRATEDKLTSSIAYVENALADYENRGLVSDSIEQAKIDALQKEWADWKAASQPVRQLSLAQQTEEATNRFNAQLNPIGAALDKDLDDELAYKVALSRKAEVGSAEAVTLSNNVAIALGVVAMLVGVVVMMLALHRITRPLVRITDAMNDIAAGNLDRDIPCLDLSDEVGEIGRALGAIREATAARARAEGEQRLAAQREVTSSLGDGLSAIREGRLTVRIDRAFPTEYEQLRHDFNTAVATLAQTIGDVTGAAQNVRIGAGEIASAASDLSGRTESQAAALEESAAAMRQLAATATSSAQTAAEASVTALEANREATDSGAVMGQAVIAMEAISRSSSRMEEIVALIDGIAFQTNLLALNAGVEAARAGESGRGFAVVATEVRALAQRSAEAAKDIAEIIRTSGRDVGTGVQMMGQTQSSLERIVERTTLLSEMIGTIARSTEEQSSAIRQVDAVVSEMDRITQANAALVEESTAASRSLSSEADGLGVLVDRFDVGRGAGEAQVGNVIWRSAA